MSINKDLPYKEIPSYVRNRGQFYTTIKTQRLLKNKVRIIHPYSGTLELWKVFWLNLQRVFGRYHTGIFFALVLQISSRAREYHMAYLWFSTSSVGAICGKALGEAILTTSWTKSCMVLTRSMAKTTYNQGDELQPIAPERQVQTLTAAVEHLTKQNHGLKEQLPQKNVAMNT